MKELEQPLISIIVPVYKVEKYLKRCVDSILTQTYQNMEIILVDDGSPDNCGAICDRYKETDNRVVVIHKKNGGLSDARNTAIPLAKGEYISFIDSDDWISSYYVEHLYEAVAKCDADIGISWFENVFEGKALQSKPEELLSNYECLTAEECLKKLLYQNGVEVCAWGKLYKTPLIKNLRYPVGKLYEDIPVTYEAVKQSKKIAVIGNVDYYYFQRTDSIQNIAFNVRKMDGIEHCHNMMKAVEADFPELKNAAECRYFSTVCNILFQIKDDKHESIRQPLWNEVLKYRKMFYLMPKQEKRRE
ncbi:MAG: glycosyltransferase family 2 protein [Blautia massiliensis (ex Durand et al. 2017)]|uniref:glycosyltransferase family 2 protein n=1 Tax=Blautia massiliensis (ex Durand et al. 2017) TaxID=1737424 RepID=UPI00399177DA